MSGAGIRRNRYFRSADDPVSDSLPARVSSHTAPLPNPENGRAPHPGTKLDCTWCMIHRRGWMMSLIVVLPFAEESENDGNEAVCQQSGGGHRSRAWHWPGD